MDATTALPVALPTLLGEIYLGSRTGRLLLTREGEGVGLSFHRGRLVGAHPLFEDRPPLPAPARDDELGRHLSRVLRELRIERRRVEEGARPPLSRDPLLQTVGWTAGQAVFAEEKVEDRHEAAATTEELLLRAVELMPEEAVRAALGDIERPLGLALNPDFDHELSQTDAYILSRVDGKTSAAEVLQLVASSSESPERRLLGLVLTGVVALLEPAAKAPPAPTPRPSEAAAPPSAPPEGALPAAQTVDAVDAVDEEAKKRAEPRRSEVLAAYEALAHLSHFEVLGVKDTASDHEIKQAFFLKAKQYHPDQYRDPGFADIVDRIEAVFLRIGGAYEVLRDPESRRSYEAVLKRRRAADAPRPPQPSAAEPERPASDSLIDTAENAWMAEEAIHRAERLIADGKVWDAIQLLQAVVPRIFGRKQRDRARVLLAKAYIKNPNWVRRGEELLQTVVQEDAQNAEAHFTLGLLYKESGLTSRALAMFKKTIELKPEHRQAQAELNALSGPAFLRKLFGKG